MAMSQPRATRSALRGARCGAGVAGVVAVADMEDGLDDAAL
ncbi:hypothetical protein AMB3_0382 [plant metagenome]